MACLLRPPYSVPYSLPLTPPCRRCGRETPMRAESAPEHYQRTRHTNMRLCLLVLWHRPPAAGETTVWPAYGVCVECQPVVALSSQPHPRESWEPTPPWEQPRPQRRKRYRRVNLPCHWCGHDRPWYRFAECLG